MTRDRRAILLLAHGAPERAEDVPEFLRNVRGGRPLPVNAVTEIAERYRRIGGSPLLRWTRRQAELLAAATDLPVYIGMRNWHPFIADAGKKIVGAGTDEVTAICLAPQNSRTSVGLYRKHLDQALQSAGAPIGVRFVESWHDEPNLIRAYADRLRVTLKQAKARGNDDPAVILTAHSVPERTVAEGDPYDAQVKETARLVAGAADVGAGHWSLAYQSQAMSEGPWLGPTVESTIDRLAEGGVAHVVIQPIGFVCDHVEVLYDIDIVFREYAQRKAMTVWRPESLNDHPGLIAALREVALQSVPAAR